PSTGQRPAAATPCRASSPASPGQSSRLWSCSLLSVGGWISYAPILPPAGRMGQRGLLSAVFGKETRSFLHPAAPTVATESTISTVSRYPPKPTKSTVSTKSRFHGTPRKARNQRFQRNHD